MPHIDGPAGRLWVEVRGGDEPVTIFAHGITSSTEELRPLAARTPGTRVLFDFRGHGRSDSPPREAGYGIASMRADLVLVADHFAATRAVGVSLGGETLLHLLAEAPERFERLVLFIPSRLDDPATADADGLERLARLLEDNPPARAAELLLAAPEYAPLLQARPRWAAWVRARVRRMNATGVPRALRAYAAEGAPIPDPERLRRVRAPALVLAHEGDPVHDASVARRLAGILPGATLRTWPEPLAMYDELPAFAELIGRFIGGD